MSSTSRPAVWRVNLLACALASLCATQAFAAACTAATDQARTIRHSAPPPAPGSQCIVNGGQTLTVLNPATYPAALCNDATPGAYWFRSGVGEGATRWVIYLEGGRKCLNNADCQTRAATYPLLISSNNIGNQALGGVMSASKCINPTFYDANIVKIHYCSSDYWSGAAAASATPFDPANASGTWNFQGRAIAGAVITDLAQRGLAGATDILLAGSAAGGIGITTMFNDLMPMMPAGARLLMMDDAGYSIDVAGYDPTAAAPTYTSSATPTPGETILTEGASLWGGRGDAKCESAGASQGQAYDFCRSSSFVVTNSYIPVPVLDLESLLDSAQLQDDDWTGPYKPGTPNYGYANWWATQMAASLSASGAANSVFAPYRLMHTLTDKNTPFTTLYAFPAGPISPQQALAQWYASPCTRLVVQGVLN